MKQETKLLLILLSILLFLSGTFQGNEEGFALIYNIKNNKSFGIDLGFVNQFRKNSRFAGMPISLLYNKFKQGSKTNGIAISVANIQEKGSVINGVVIGVIDGNQKNEGGTINGVEITLASLAKNKSKEFVRKVNGLQIGVYNASAGHCFQIGLINRIYMDNGKYKNGFLLNYYFGKKYEKFSGPTAILLLNFLLIGLLSIWAYKKIKK